MSLVQMSVGGGVLILFTVLVRSVALHKLPKTTFFILWGMTVLRLLLPVSIPSPFSVYTQTERIFPSPEPEAPEAAVTEFVNIPASIHAPVPAAPPAQADPAPIPVLTVLWLAGASLLAVSFAAVYIRSRRKFRVSLPEESPFVRDWLAQRRSLRPIQVRQSDRILSPLTYGVLRPVILLPKRMDRTNEAALTCILAHEYVHIRRFDAVTKLVLAAALCIHWFNPLVWVMYILANRDLELSCDGQVLRMLGKQGRKPYALTLLEMEESKQNGFTLFSHFGKFALEERMEAIMKYKKTSVLAVFLAVALVVGAATALATSAVEDTPDTDSSQTAPGVQPPDGTDGVGEPDSDGGRVLFSDVMTYEQFLQSGLTNSVDNQLEADRQVLVTVLYYPDGYEHHRVGMIPNCLAVSLKDAETMELLGSEFFDADTVDWKALITSSNTVELKGVEKLDESGECKNIRLAPGEEMLFDGVLMPTGAQLTVYVNGQSAVELQAVLQEVSTGETDTRLLTVEKQDGDSEYVGSVTFPVEPSENYQLSLKNAGNEEAVFAALLILQQPQGPGAPNIVQANEWPGLVRIPEEENSGEDGEGTIMRLEDLDSDIVEFPAQRVEDDGMMTLIAVRHSDESKFTPEKWAEILEKIENGEMYWED